MQEQSAAVAVLTWMNRYHFDLVDTESVMDVNGGILEDDDQAKRLAMELARKVREGRPELVGKGCEIRVRGEQGDEISRVSIDRLPKEGDSSEQATGRKILT